MSTTPQRERAQPPTLPTYPDAPPGPDGKLLAGAGYTFLDGKWWDVRLQRPCPIGRQPDPPYWEARPVLSTLTIATLDLVRAAHAKPRTRKPSLATKLKTGRSVGANAVTVDDARYEFGESPAEVNEWDQALKRRREHGLH